ncbi:MAG: thioesterase family protein [Anaerolineae bacterium]|jgi:fluoroacetyl-CoA thioesterase
MESFAPPTGTQASVSLLVTAGDTALAVHSGGLQVLASPRMVALMEEAAVAALAPYVPSGWQTVGTRLDVRHTAATPVGCTVTATARLVELDRRRVVLAVSAHDEAGPIGEGVHERFLVESEPFMLRAAARRGVDAATSPR